MLQRPLHHYDANTAKMVLQLLKAVLEMSIAMFDYRVAYVCVYLVMFH